VTIVDQDYDPHGDPQVRKVLLCGLAIAFGLPSIVYAATSGLLAAGFLGGPDFADWRILAEAIGGGGSVVLIPLMLLCVWNVRRTLSEAPRRILITYATVAALSGLTFWIELLR
jgi:hypothetical protein